MKAILLFTGMLMSQLLSGQRLILLDNDLQAQNLIKEGDAAYFRGDFKKSIQSYQQLAEIKHHDPEVLFNLAIGFMANGKTDSTFHLLFAIIDSGYRQADFIRYTAEFEKLHGSAKWKTLIKELDARFTDYCKTNSITNEKVAKQLDYLFYIDQKYQRIGTFKRRYAGAYPQYTDKAIDSLQDNTFRKNVDYLKQLFAKDGYLWKSDIGKEAAHISWIIAQHADFDTAFQKEYLRKMKVAVDMNEASAKDYAYLTDRVRKNTGEKQLYGTQMNYITTRDSTGKIKVESGIWPVEDEANLNQRRKEVGLVPIEEYLQMMKLLNNH
ncbi:DUF6624 domain-containing protein [Chitinophaga sp. LS1]|uniref:DUF6624 domain-containing protein n=1 Tax=Chitinophaga sp. LS1 TaxID=3051176 RepID=UPI002AAC2BED|nr:DUF6624 domain-containing protein [Chitinophaga sp. LS1]WPV67019.1 hypothetical protein QQL36_35080 [Chitinophaga sp. LS1]